MLGVSRLLLRMHILRHRRKQVTGIKAELRARVGRPQTSRSSPVILLLAVPGGSSVLVVGDFRCGALLFMIIHVIYKYENRST